MKLCPKCCSVLADEMVVCTNCGHAFSPAPEKDEPALALPLMEEPVQADEQADTPQKSAPPEPKKKDKKILWIVGGVLTVALVVFLIAGIATNWFGGPLREVELAIQKTARVNSLQINIEVSNSLSDQISAMGPYPSYMEYQFVLDREDQNAQILYTLTQGLSFTKVLISDGKRYEVSSGTDGYVTKGSCKEVEKEMFRDLFLILDGEYLQDDKKVKELLEKYDLETDVDTFISFLEFLKRDCLGDREWVEKYLGFEKKKDRFIFEIDANDLVKELCDLAYDAGVITKEQKKLWTTNPYDLDYDIEITLKHGFLSKIEIVTDYTYSDTSYKITFRGINDTVIDDSEQNAIKNDYDTYMRTYFAYCPACNKHQEKKEMNQVDTSFYCDDCYEARARCVHCKKFMLKDELEQFDDQYVCADCFEDHILQNYSSCIDCNYILSIKDMYKVNGAYYCYTCYTSRSVCYGCFAFEKRSNLKWVGGETYCLSCYDEYVQNHTCDLCGDVVSQNNICFAHYVYDSCGKCGKKTHLYYYNVKDKKHYCISCL